AKFPEAAKLGGAPANFAFHAAQLGACAEIVSRIGTDADGDAIVAELKSHGVSTSYLQRDASHPTGTVIVSLDRGQPDYTITRRVAWDFIEWSLEVEDLARCCHAVCFGSLAQRGAASRAAIQRFV